MLQKLECFEDLWRLQFLNAQFLVPAGLIDSDLARFIEDKARQQKVEMYKNEFKVKGSGK